MVKRNRPGCVAVLMIGALLVVSAETGLALGRTITFFSEISGLLVDADGAPQAGVRIMRSWKRTPEDEPMVDEAVTLWKTVKTNFDPNGELHGRPLNLECRIDKEPEGDGSVWGTCREARGSFAPAAAGGGEELKLSWQWPAGRPVEIEILVRLEQVKPERRSFLGIRNSPSLGGSLPDPYEIAGKVVQGPEVFRGKRITLRVPGAEVKGLNGGGIAAFGLIEDGCICISVTPAPPGIFTE